MKKVKKLPAVITILLVTLTISSSFAQSKYLDRNGVLIFEASEKLFEEVKATNESVTAIYNEETNQIASLALIKGFRFKNSLMEEHFNENYIESDVYPKAIFSGKLIDFNPKEDFGNKSIEVKVKGILEVHGKQKEIETVLKVQKVAGTISMAGQFKVTPADFDIAIPKIVRNKIAKEVTVSLDFKLVAK
ncbi:MAG: YceI family protein [Flavobacteriaceae bacterium]|nr:YceI family protein [Flavobacteriaceae bacterium]